MGVEAADRGIVAGGAVTTTRLSARSPVPTAAVLQHIAVLGKTGSGKSYAVRGVVEDLLDQGERVCIIDPTGVWYGLRTLADGKRAGYPVAIFGGNHGDFPLGGHHGDELAEIIGTSSTPAIIDTSLLRTGERVRLFTDLAEGLLRKNRGPLHLIIDEAHLFAPQGRVSDPQSGAMLHAANNLVSLGRSRGLRIVLITQRPAKLHKDSLTQVETLIALRLIAPQDRRAVEEWIKDNADDVQGKAVISSLAALKTGSAWLWAPELGVLERVTFPKIRTLDSGRAPDGTEISGQVLAAIDRDAIAARLKAVAQEAIDNDPKRLRARIAELEREAKRPKELAVDADLLARMRQEGFDEGKREALRLHRELRDRLVAVLGDEPAMPAAPPENPIRRVAAPSVGSATASRNGVPLAGARARQIDGGAVGSTGPALPMPRQKILDKLRWLERHGVYPAPKETLAAMAGVSPTSGGYFNNLGALRSLGVIEYPQPGAVAFTSAGRSQARETDDDRPIHEHWLDVVSNPQRAILARLIAVHPDRVSKDHLARSIGVSATSGGYFNNLGRLRTLGAIDYPEPGYVALTDHVMP